MKKLGNTRRMAVIGYAIPLTATLLLCLWAMVTAETQADSLAALDRWMSHTIYYVPVAMGTILGISGVIKSATKIAEVVKAKKEP